LSRLTKITVVVLTLAVIGILGALFLEAASGPTFRAEDHADYHECMRNIPREWLPNSLERQGAETACVFVHARGQRS
jgi:hypothetical protein